MDTDTLLFFAPQPGALPLYKAFAEEVTARYPDTSIRVQKSQISFYNRHMFACVSFLRVKKKRELPEPYLVVTLGHTLFKENKQKIAEKPYYDCVGLME